MKYTGDMSQLAKVFVTVSTLLTVPNAIYAHTTDGGLIGNEFVHLLTHPHHVIIFLAVGVIGAVLLSVFSEKIDMRSFVAAFLQSIKRRIGRNDES